MKWNPVKSFIAGLIIAIAAGTAGAQGNTIVRGEVSPGVYANIAVNGSGNLLTASTTLNVAVPIVAIPVGTYTSIQTQATQINTIYSSINIVCNVTAVTAVQTVTFALDIVDSGGNFVNLLSSTPVGTVSTITISYGTGHSLITGTSAGGHLPYRWRMRAIHSGVGPFTYGCEAGLSRI